MTRPNPNPRIPHQSSAQSNSRPYSHAFLLSRGILLPVSQLSSTRSIVLVSRGRDQQSTQQTKRAIAHTSIGDGNLLQIFNSNLLLPRAVHNIEVDHCKKLNINPSPSAVHVRIQESTRTRAGLHRQALLGKTMSMFMFIFSPNDWSTEMVSTRFTLR